MIPEKIGRADLPQETSISTSDTNRTHSLSVYENGKVVGKFIYDRLSSAVSLIHELKVLAQIKFTQLEISDQSASLSISLAGSGQSKNSCQQSEGIKFEQILKQLGKQIDISRQNQMPCTLVLMSASIDGKTIANHDSFFIDLTSIIGSVKKSHDLLFWYPLDFEGSDSQNHAKQVYNEQFSETGFCLILPSSGLLKARLLIDEVKKSLNEPQWSHMPVSINAGIGVNTTNALTAAELFAQVKAYLSQSELNGGKVFCAAESSNCQVSVEERAQLFMISKKTLE